MTLRRLTLVLLSLAPFSLAVAPPTMAVPAWAPAANAAIHPGVQTFTNGAQCTSNFVFHDGNHVYLGQAAHCSSSDVDGDADGCRAQSLPIGTKVTVQGASKPGTLVYNSWLTMRAKGEKNRDVCLYNDFALVQLDPADAAKVNPSVPFWGGPNGLNTSGADVGTPVYSYGNSSVRLGLAPLSPKRGVSVGDEGGGWNHQVTTLTPGVPGDSGSAFLDGAGRALGVLSTLDIGVPGGVTNGVTDLRRALDYMRANTPFTGVQLALGTVPFNGSRLPLALGLL